jgi:hypothetical protein
MPITQTASGEKVQADLRSHAAPGSETEAAAATPVGASEAAGLPGVASGAEPGRAHELQVGLAALESRFTAMSERLSQAVSDFKGEILPDGALGADLTKLQADFGVLRARAAELAVSLSVPAAPISGPKLRLEPLRQLLRAIDDAERRQVFRELQDRAASELKRALAIVYRGNVRFAPLEQCKDTARRRLAEITASEWPHSTPECRPLADRQHAISRLLDLVCYGAELSDADCEAAVDAVSATFGQALAIAALRGRLTLEAETKTPAAAVERCPSCGAELDPGARFCGECGAKI